MHDLTKKLQITANVATILVSILLGIVLINNFLLGPFSKGFNGNKGIAAGAKVSLPGVSWGKNSRTVVLALNQQCHFCRESAPFYQRLLRQTAGSKEIGVIAVFPEGSSQNEKYLNDLGVEIHEIKETSFASLGIAGTPSLVLVDNKGIASDVWVGRLSGDKEEEVLKRLK